MTPRRPTRQISVGDARTGIVRIGGSAPVSVQTMTAGYTHDIDTCVAEINKLAAAGADIVRVAVPERKDTEALKEIIRQTSAPIVADVHFHYKRALEAVEAGVHKIRLNPGNISDREQVNAVIDACKERGIPIRVGVNEGSIIERKDKQKRMEELGKYFAGHKLRPPAGADDRETGRVHRHLPRARDFHDICISAKSMDPGVDDRHLHGNLQAIRLPAALGCDARRAQGNRLHSFVVALGTLLANGIGDTVRISYASDPVYEVEDALEMLYCLQLRPRIGAELIACPTCGRIQVDLFTLVQEVRKKLARDIEVPIKVAVMGCVVNGPGEAEGADVAVFAGDRRGIIYVQGEKVANVPEEEILERLLHECREFQSKVKRGEAKLGEKKVEIIPPDPIGELGSGFEKIAQHQVEQVTVGRT